MGKGRLEAFSDGFFAIIITIMVLEIKVPHGEDLSALKPLIPVLLSYILSFIYIAIYWNNHHHLFHAVHKVNGKILWANMHLLFWLSLVPIVTGWIGDNHTSCWPAASYGFTLLMAAFAWYILSHSLIKHHGENSKLANAYGNDLKGKISIALYLSAIFLAFVNTFISFGIYFLVAMIWIVPDKRIEKEILN